MVGPIFLKILNATIKMIAVHTNYTVYNISPINVLSVVIDALE